MHALVGAVPAISDPQSTGICLIHGSLMCKEEIRRSDDTGFVAIRAVNCPAALRHWEALVGELGASERGLDR
jgi:hypothetical protein